MERKTSLTPEEIAFLKVEIQKAFPDCVGNDKCESLPDVRKNGDMLSVQFFFQQSAWYDYSWLWENIPYTGQNHTCWFKLAPAPFNGRFRRETYSIGD